MKYTTEEITEKLESWKKTIDNMKDIGMFSLGDARMKKEMLDFLIEDFSDGKTIEELSNKEPPCTE